MVAAGAIAAAASGQTMDVQRPRTLIVGASATGVRVEGLDAARSGRARTALPTGGVRVEWRASLGVPTEWSPLVDSAGNLLVVGARGEIVSTTADGDERWRLSTGAMQPGPGALLSDGTLVFVDAAGEAVAVRDGAVRWRVRFGRSDGAHPAPVPLDDGGVVVATAYDLAALDSTGRERARTTLPEPTQQPLVGALGRIVAITASGVIWSWSPGAAEPTRIGSFGGPIDDAAGLVDDHTLLAVTSGRTRLAAVDLVRGTTIVRASLPAGLWLGPAALRGDDAFLLLLGSTTELAVALDSSGTETMRVALVTRPALLGADGGIATLVAPPHTAPVVDGAGTMAFATTDGAVGVVAGGVVDILPDACPPAGARGSAAPTAGLVPTRPGAFVAACRSGTLLSLRGPSASGEPAAPHL